ncbi:hypothetical protein [Thalassotalea marina]|uniref:Transcription elongation factor GreAB n=1 Tax=Thalassotalea marina TaxID=1673741 RepID=A0A919EJ28_9GAMM|nr:hypothetical protein [Thalassotalea marina]GHF86801.1 hypothetical protein GCM10017161_12840 [Thalassotalea marina]
MKNAIKAELLEQLKSSLIDAELAAKNARLASIDEQSVAETQYDTLAIEASYLAEGQSRRVDELKLSIELINKLIIDGGNDIVGIASLVTLSKNENLLYFLAPTAAGYRLNVEEKQVVVITDKSPIGRALLGKGLGDEIHLVLGKNVIDDEISAII